MLPLIDWTILYAKCGNRNEFNSNPCEGQFEKSPIVCEVQTQRVLPGERANLSIGRGDIL